MARSRFAAYLGVSPTLMRLRIASLTVVAALLGGPWAVAHPPYEGPPRIVPARGGELEVVKSYVDGIIGTDPAKVIVRSRGTALAETEYYRDASLACYGARCLIAAAQSPFFLIPERVWILEDRSLRSVDSLSIRVIGTAVHFSDHLFGYALSLVFVLLPLAALRPGARVNDQTSAAGCLAGLVAVAACGILLLWLYTIVVLSELSLPWALLFAIAVIATRRAVGARRANNEMKLTRSATA